ncbi:hypothetical protein PHMEG_00025421 [Phytophthora megakarya]|uniref:Bzip transcription factor n=1 Tax=Phytophthora megakarya TaxID=4795 RepID=A0A225VC68_9STRA|nr:hypothetical protein PHMEG_00025421 [Phytophthora megakarya]
MPPPGNDSQEPLNRNRAFQDACPTQGKGNKSDGNPSQLIVPPVTATPGLVEAADLAFRRYRGRVNQARYRRRKINGLKNLEESLDSLREEICQLNKQKQVTSLYVSMTSTALRVVVEYFSLFRFGNDIYGGPTATIQRSFLTKTMAPDITDGTVVGLPALLKNWEFMSLCLQDIDMQPTRIENGPAGLTIAKKLVGKKLMMDGTFQFKYDEQSSRITYFKSTPDMLTPLLHLLGTLEDVAYMFENAAITPECKMAQWAL